MKSKLLVSALLLSSIGAHASNLPQEGDKLVSSIGVTSTFPVGFELKIQEMKVDEGEFYYQKEDGSCYLVKKEVKSVKVVENKTLGVTLKIPETSETVNMPTLCPGELYDSEQEAADEESVAEGKPVTD